MFVPALFAQWAPQLVRLRSRARRVSHVLDVACGTGVVARAARQTSWVREGRVAGVDLNPAMLEVGSATRSLTSSGYHGDAADLPFEPAPSTSCCASRRCSSSPTPPAPFARWHASSCPEASSPSRPMPRWTSSPPTVPSWTLVAATRRSRRHAILLGTYWSQGDLDGLLDLTAASGLSPLESRSSLGVPSSRPRPRSLTPRSTPPRSPTRSHGPPTTRSSPTPRSYSAGTPTGRALYEFRSGPLC